jgi:hypothetical protein
MTFFYTCLEILYPWHWTDSQTAVRAVIDNNFSIHVCFVIQILLTSELSLPCFHLKETVYRKVEPIATLSERNGNCGKSTMLVRVAKELQLLEILFY